MGTLWATMPYKAKDWLGYHVPPVSTLTLNRLMKTFSVRKRTASMFDFGDDGERSEGEVLCDTLHMLEHEGDNFVAGTLFAAPDLSRGNFGNVVGERFFVDASGSFLSSHITLLYETGIISYLRIITSEVGNMYLKMVCFHPSAPDKLLLAMSVDERRDCDYCFTRQSACVCMTVIKQRYKDWFSIFRNLRKREKSTWELFRALCDIAADGHFRVNMRAWVPGPGGMQKIMDTQCSYKISFLLRGEALEKRRQQCINSRVNINLDNLFDVYAQLMEEDDRVDEVPLDERHLLSDLSNDPTFGPEGFVSQTARNRPTSSTNSEEAQSCENHLDDYRSENVKWGSQSSGGSSPVTSFKKYPERKPGRDHIAAGMIKDDQHNRPAQHYRCPTCGRTFPSNYKIDRHIRAVHLRERSFKCHLCPSQYYQKSDLKKHFRVRHSNAENEQSLEACEDI
eukprot:Plantae.Rhodophyta-Purpureofilum_apyrenoidigerum.ctg5047.p1 GENE.Plantae.Rhodophyta-Purpureofilum_apyrenoidigerum.ctg5047~~Plantae.Rhodophyta-Purpureofilum_apyrenoidigerum.ctg5047.p1  ORF type:complete len:485 (-),score=56.85 Plantae.Rhodophyta-Purpureofilum_apyrenoidigerum.ctg5047:617-1972(-)